ncbi:uncharacterized protein LOC116255263 [Nymphaea colorata]|nr:uncharacterized protein LOC116255263 [Nymphaea colorata]
METPAFISIVVAIAVAVLDAILMNPERNGKFINGSPSLSLFMAFYWNQESFRTQRLGFPMHARQMPSLIFFFPSPEILVWFAFFPVQILSMHGFCKLYRAKVHLLEALGSVQLVSPFRSTLVVGARPAPLTPDDVALDAADLNWRECPMVSMNSLTLGSAAMAAAAAEVEEVGGASHLLQNVAEARRQRSSFALGPPLHRQAIPKKKRTRRVKVAEAELLVTALFGSNGSPPMVDDVLGLSR